ncbi:hypothetical protein [Candidatus Nitrosotenuis uzonensis]|uniref:Uncharacterized protein n=1 Tax=Candidatus Nitrosotenuis uzonensis TaxID=1407055 RepID=A0A812F530_9ARCH|nr:hypothetical protein [Candidatus Nitrosotenuis uzonensis]CAE6489006.1 membrane hypothetical protein [Candidatus Nitrosotenuis uzonensis]
MEIQDFFQISGTDLFQANATIIAGILVFLTVSVFTDKMIIMKRMGDPIAYIAFSPLAFGVSLGALICGSVTTWNPKLFFIFSIGSFLFGLFYLFLSIILVGWSIAQSRRNDQNQ